MRMLERVVFFCVMCLAENALFRSWAIVSREPSSLLARDVTS